MKQRFKDHMGKSKKLTDELRKEGINADMNKDTGEITIDLKSIYEKFKNQKEND